MQISFKKDEYNKIVECIKKYDAINLFEIMENKVKENEEKILKNYKEQVKNVSF